MENKIIKGNETVVINIPAVETWNITALRHACKKNKVKGYSKMPKDQLIAEVKKIIERVKSR